MTYSGVRSRIEGRNETDSFIEDCKRQKAQMVLTCQQVKGYTGQVYDAGKCGAVKEEREAQVNWTGKNMIDAGQATANKCKWKQIVAV